jgi:hypothetical protein
MNITVFPDTMAHNLIKTNVLEKLAAFISHHDDGSRILFRNVGKYQRQYTMNHQRKTQNILSYFSMRKSQCS